MLTGTENYFIFILNSSCFSIFSFPSLQSLKTEYLAHHHVSQTDVNAGIIEYLFLLLIGSQYMVDESNDHSSLVHKQFIEKLVAIDVTKTKCEEEVEFPAKHGVYDGIILTLYSVNASNELNETTLLAIMVEMISCFAEDSYEEEENPIEYCKWNLISYQGMIVFVNLMVDIFTRLPNAFATMIPEERVSSVMYALGLLLQIDSQQKSRFSCTSKRLIHSLDDNLTAGVTKVLCLPFALDLEQSLTYEILCSLYQCQTLNSLLTCVQTQPLRKDREQTSIVVGLIARLVLTDEMFVAQFKGLLNDSTGLENLLTEFIFESKDTGVRCDMLAILSHLARQSSDNSRIVGRIFQQNEGLLVLFVLL